jgi:hypothetical protein
VHRPEGVDCGPVIDVEPDLSSFPASNDSGLASPDPATNAGDAGIPHYDASVCQKNADCVDGPNGRCEVYTSGTETFTQCSYACSTDADCGIDEACECMGEARACVPARCRSDADCAPGHACARFAYEDWCDVEPQYACTTDADTCRTEQECDDLGDPTLTGCSPHASDTDEGAHCERSSCVDGRPFLIAGSARTAAVTERADWSKPSAPDLTALDAQQRLYLSEHWARIGQMEHASIAAFARFALQLLSVGAPPELIAATNAAMVDETLHTRLAFGLASVYRGHALGPAALDCTGALGACDLESIVMGTLLEGCIGETLAALDAKRALERCEDRAVSAVLETIVKDETRHAELAWKFVQWAFEVDPSLASKALAVAKSEHETARSQHRASRPASQTSWQSRYGVTSRAEQTELHAQVLEQIVLPCLTALAASSEHRARTLTTQGVQHNA